MGVEQSQLMDETSSMIDETSSMIEGISSSHSAMADYAEGNTNQSHDSVIDAPIKKISTPQPAPYGGFVATPPTSSFQNKMVAFVFSHVGLVALVVLYTVMGGFLFKHLEGESEIMQRTVVSRLRSYTISKVWNMTTELVNPEEGNWSVLAQEIMKEFQDSLVMAIKESGWDGRNEENKDVKWSLPGSLLYSITVLTTIGYGHITPKTQTGRIATMLYALPGIPITLLCLSTIGTTWAKCFRFFYRNLIECIYGQPADVIEDSQGRKKRGNTRVPLTVSLMVMGGYIAAGSILFSLWEEDWDYLIAAYFCFVTLSTIGFGDFVFGVSKDLDSNAKLVTSGVYLIMGLSIIAMCFNLMQEEVQEKFLTIGKYFGFIDKKKRLKHADTFY